MAVVVHDGTDYQYEFYDTDLASFTISGDAVGVAAFYFATVLSLEGLRSSSVITIRDYAFSTSTNVMTLEDCLPPTLKFIGNCSFESCPLVALTGIPYATKVHEHAFGAAQTLEDCLIDTRCRGLLERAAALGFPSIDAWVQYRQLVPSCRACLLWSVSIGVDLVRLEQEVSPLLALMVKLPEELVRELAQFAYGDYR
jgi:hypothetical protein